jgi:hypothetical protein
MVSLLASSCIEPQLGFFFDLLAIETLKHMANFDATTLCCLLRGHAIASQQGNVHSSPLRRDTVHKVCVEIERRMGVMNRQHLLHMITSLQQMKSGNCDGLCDAIQQSVLMQWDQFSLTSLRQIVLGLSKIGCNIRHDFHQQCVQSGRLARAFGANSRVFERDLFESSGAGVEGRTSTEDFDVCLDLMQNSAINLDFMQSTSFTGNDEFSKFQSKDRSEFKSKRPVKILPAQNHGPQSFLATDVSGGAQMSGRGALKLSPPPGLETYRQDRWSTALQPVSEEPAFNDDLESFGNVDFVGPGSIVSTSVEDEHALAETSFHFTRFGTASEMQRLAPGHKDGHTPMRLPEPVHCPYGAYPSQSLMCSPFDAQGIFESPAEPCRGGAASFNPWDSHNFNPIAMARWSM